jgi:L-asparaginase
MPIAGRTRVAVFCLGGTIAMAPTAGGGVTPAFTGAELLAAVPGLDEVPVELTVHDLRRLPGPSLSFADLFELSAAIERTVADGVDGVVVTQGTDTIEETAYLLDLTYDGDAPVVVTGAMRHPSMAGADGPANLLAAVRVAASAAARNLGCLVVLVGEIHAARWVAKTHTSSLAAFVSPGFGPLGRVVENNVHIPGRCARGPKVGDVEPANVPVVAVATVTFGEDGRLVAALAEHAAGLVIAAFGAGHVPATSVPALSHLAERMPVVLASRTGAGPVHEATYRYAGSEMDLLARGLINAGYLHPLKARILLCLLLAARKSRTEIVQMFATAGGILERVRTADLSRPAESNSQHRMQGREHAEHQ